MEHDKLVGKISVTNVEDYFGKDFNSKRSRPADNKTTEGCYFPSAAKENKEDSPRRILIVRPTERLEALLSGMPDAILIKLRTHEDALKYLRTDKPSYDFAVVPPDAFGYLTAALLTGNRQSTGRVIVFGSTADKTQAGKVGAQAARTESCLRACLNLYSRN